METLQITDHEHAVVRGHTPDRLVVDVTYTPAAKRPPLHLHPAQAESLTVRSGALRVKIGGEERVYCAGERFGIPTGVAHSMAPEGDEPVEATWETTPAGRTLEWFQTLDRQTRAGRTGVLDLAPHLVAFEDTFRLAGPRPVMAVALRLLAGVGGLRSRVPGRSGAGAPR